MGWVSNSSEPVVEASTCRPSAYKCWAVRIASEVTQASSQDQQPTLEILHGFMLTILRAACRLLVHYFWPWALVRSILCQSYRLLNLSETAAVDDAATRSVWPRSSPCPNGALGRSHPRHPSQIRRRLGTRPGCSSESESVEKLMFPELTI